MARDERADRIRRLRTLADPGGPREKLARFYILRLLPEHAGLLVHAQAGSVDLFAMTADELAA